MLMDTKYTRGGEDLIIQIIAEPLRCIFETNTRLYINDTSGKIFKKDMHSLNIIDR